MLSRLINLTEEQKTIINNAVNNLINDEKVNGESLQDLINKGIYNSSDFKDYLLECAKNPPKENQTKGGRRKHRTRCNKKQRKHRTHRNKKHRSRKH